MLAEASVSTVPERPLTGIPGVETTGYCQASRDAIVAEASATTHAAE